MENTQTEEPEQDSIVFRDESNGIEAALRKSCDRLQLLVEEVEAFVPRDLEQTIQYVKQIQNLDGPVFGQWSEEDKERWYADKAKLYLPLDRQIRAFIGDRFEAEYITIVLTSSALIEAIINSYLQFLLAKHKREQMFDAIDKWSLLDKWLYGLTLVIPSYSFPKTSALWNVLKELVDIRNATVHYKMMLEINGRKVYKGKSLYHAVVRNQLPWLKKVANLPFELQLMLMGHVLSLGPTYHPPSLIGIKSPFPETPIIKKRQKTKHK